MKDNKVVLNVGRDYPAEEGFLSFDKQTGKEAANCWAKPNLHNNAFTLIELLVVVLIIGILAAVAVPQYQKAVNKSRASTMFALVRAFYEAEKVYYLEHGVYPTKLTEMDVDLPGDWTFNEDQNKATKGKQRLALGGSGVEYSISGHWNTDMDAYLEIYPRTQKGFCWANRNDKIANQICQSLTQNEGADRPNLSRIAYQFM